MRNGLPVAAALLLTFAVSPGIPAQRPLEPRQVPGLVAWYNADSLNDALGNGAEVSVWKDLSGNGHDLTHDEGGQSALYLESQVNGRAAVRVRPSGTYSMTDPLELSEYTIVLVYRAAANERALVRGGATQGIVLNVGGDHHHYQNGGMQPAQIKSFSEPTELPAGYSVTVLGRDASSKLHAFVEGRDVSAETEFAGPLRIVKLFAIKHTQYARSDGNGLFIAEFAIYDRYLTDEERDGLTAYLQRHYGLGRQAGAAPAVAQAPSSPGAPAPAGPPRAGTPAGSGSETAPVPEAPEITASGPSAVAQLRTVDRDNLNVDPGLPIRWTIQDVVDAPFRHDLEVHSERLHCTRDGTRVRLYASIPLWTPAPGPAIQLLLLKNGTQYLPVESLSAPFVAAARAHDPDKIVYRSMVTIEVVTQLDAGDYVELLAWKVGGDGPVVLQARQAVFIAEVK